MKYICALILFLATLLGAENQFKKRVLLATPGDYIVTESNRMISIWAIRSISQNSLVLEEISAPRTTLRPFPSSWEDWIQHQAPGHTSWSMIELDLQNHQLLECYSFSRSAWLQLADQDNLFSALLNLSLVPVPLSERKKIGPPPLDSKDLDVRKIWNPPLVHQGKRIEGAEFEAFKTVWIDDGSELAGKNVTLYFDKAGLFPLPFWVQVEASHGAANLRVIDSGTQLPCMHRSIPRRVPEFIGSPKKTQRGLTLSIKSPKYYRSFDLFAIDITSKEKQIYPVTHSIIASEGEMLQLQIDQEELKNILQADHRYKWLLIPTGYSELYSETRKPFMWKIDR